MKQMFVFLFLSTLLHDSCISTDTASTINPKNTRGETSRQRHPYQDFTHKDEKSTTTVIDNFAEPLLLQRLNQSKLWEDCMERGETWLGFHDMPSTLLEELAVRIWQRHPIVHTHRIAGYTIWCNVVPAATPTGQTWHVDKDKAMFRPKYYGLNGPSRIVQPLMGAFFWGYPHEVEGGDLEILPFQDWSQDVTTSQDAMEFYHDHKINQVEVEIIEPIYNRLVTCNVSKWHRVSPVLEGPRFVLAVDLWHNKPAKENFIGGAFSIPEDDEEEEGEYQEDFSRYNGKGEYQEDSGKEEL